MQPDSSASVQEHRAQAQQRGGVALAVLTVSDTRQRDTDRSGQLMRQLVAETEHRVVAYEVVRDEPARIREAIDALCATPARAILTNGGTGISRRDQTCDVVEGLLDKALPGFGELFRMLSYAEVGAAALLSRATAGVYRDRFVFCMPGSPHAVRLAMTQLILPEIQHLASELLR